MAGLLDHYLFLGHVLALEMVLEQAAYFMYWHRDVTTKEGEAHWYKMLENEYGGMEEVLWNVFNATGEPSFAQ